MSFMDLNQRRLTTTTTIFVHVNEREIQVLFITTHAVFTHSQSISFDLSSTTTTREKNFKPYSSFRTPVNTSFLPVAKYS